MMKKTYHSHGRSEAKLVVEICKTHTMGAIVTKARIADVNRTVGENMIVNDVGRMLNVSETKAEKLIAGCRPRNKELNEVSEIIHARLEEIFFALIKWVRKGKYADTDRMMIRGNQGYLSLLQQIARSNGFKQVVIKTDL